MKPIKINVFVVIALGLFITTFVVRRVMIANQLEAVEETLDRLRSHEKLQRHLNALVAVVTKSDAELRGLVLSQDTRFVKEIDECLNTMGKSFHNIQKLTSADHFFSVEDTARIAILLQRNLKFIAEIKKLADSGKFEEASKKISSRAGQNITDSLTTMLGNTASEIAASIQASEQNYDKRKSKEINFSLLSYIGLILLLIWFLVLLYREIRKNHAIQYQLMEREQKLKVTLESIADGVLTTDRKGNINYLNPSAELLLSCQLLEVAGTPLKQVYHITDETTKEPLTAIFDQVIGKGQKLINRNNTVLHGRGQVDYIIENSAAPVRDKAGAVTGMVLVFRNITERVKSIKALRAAEKEFRSIYENTSEGIYRSTLEGELLMVNPAMLKIFEYESEAQMLQVVDDVGDKLFRNPADREEVMQKLKRKGRVEHFEFQGKTCSGKVIWVACNAHLVFKETGEIDYTEGTFSDITERKTYQARIERHYNMLKQYAFINSHKVRAHVATLLGLSKLLIDKHILAEEKDNILDIIYHETEQLDGVIRGLSVLINEDATT